MLTEQSESLKVKPLDQFQEHLKGVTISPIAYQILNESTTLDPSLGLKIFLDRYSKKAKRETAQVGDLVLVLVKDGKWPKKQLGIVVEDHGQEVVCKLLTGDIDAEAGSFFAISKKKINLPVESVPKALKRVAKGIASAEVTPELIAQWGEKFYDQLIQNKIQPAGRIMTGAIAPEDYNSEEDGELTLFNCYVLNSPHDSREGIVGKTLLEMTEVMSRGGGVGLTLSSLRPKRAYVKGVRGESSGSVSWGGLFSYATGLIEQGGSRRGALMLMEWCWHPDVLDFIESKTQAGMIENANISVLISNDFMKAVEEDGDWTFIFPDTKHAAYDEEWDGDIKKWQDKGYPIEEYGTIKARDMWNKIVQSAWKSAEPGVVFMEHYNDMSNSYYFNPIIATNPCGEQGLPGWGVCTLSAINLSKFYDEKNNDVKWDELEETVFIHQRFLDNVLDVTPYHFKENEENQKKERRVGGGTLGLAELLIRLGLRYGSEEAVRFCDKLYAFITEKAYLASAGLAEEKGAFPAYDERFLLSGFMQKVIKAELPHVFEVVAEKGIRNVTSITQAPTGSTGSMIGTSTGIEPYFAFEYFRQSRLGFDRIYVPLAQEYMLPDGSLPDYFVDANSLTPKQHIDMQAIIQKWCDSSISKTANVPSDFTVEQTAELYEYAFKKGCKGVTIYRDKSRDEQVLHLVSEEKTLEEKIEQSPGIVNEQVYGLSVGDKCAICREGVIVKYDGCTKCNKCDYYGSCDMK